MKKLCILLLVPGILAAAGYGWYCFHFPYGYTHCCLKVLGLSLDSYAESHDGRFPTGESCPEASLSLISRGDLGVGPETLCEKTIPAERARRVLDRGDFLGPDTCDWHYVEGLTLADDPQIAILWDKVGLGHFGERLSGGGHSIWRLGGREEVVSEAEWPEFLKEQAQLMTARTEAAKKGLPALTGKVRLPTGNVVDHFDAPFILSTSEHSGMRSGSSSGPVLTPEVLRWWRLDDGEMEISLTLNNRESKPVSVRVMHGKTTPDSIILDFPDDR
jgi:hypothetical protein